MKYRKKPIVIEAIQWFKNGDHTKDYCKLLKVGIEQSFMTEGKVVRRFNHPRIPSNDYCAICKRFMSEHGWIDTLEGGHIVCPGDWIITGVNGEVYPCKPDIFEKTYVKED